METELTISNQNFYGGNCVTINSAHAIHKGYLRGDQNNDTNAYARQFKYL